MEAIGRRTFICGLVASGCDLQPDGGAGYVDGADESGYQPVDYDCSPYGSASVKIIGAGIWSSTTTFIGADWCAA